MSKVHYSPSHWVEKWDALDFAIAKLHGIKLPKRGIQKGRLIKLNPKLLS